MSEDKPNDYKKRLSAELSNSLCRDDQGTWPPGDLGMGPDLQVNQNFKASRPVFYLIKKMFLIARGIHRLLRYVFE